MISIRLLLLVIKRVFVYNSIIFKLTDLFILYFFIQNVYANKKVFVKKRSKFLYKGWNCDWKSQLPEILTEQLYPRAFIQKCQILNGYVWSIIHEIFIIFFFKFDYCGFSVEYFSTHFGWIILFVTTQKYWSISFQFSMSLGIYKILTSFKEFFATLRKSINSFQKLTSWRKTSLK